jgi:AraC family transcriptional regulator
VVAGTFQYRTGARAELLVPGAFLLATPRQTYECSHAHGAGDRCISFQFTPERFARITGAAPHFRTSRLPPMRASAPLLARACAALEHGGSASWEELSIDVAVRAMELDRDVDARRSRCRRARSRA